MGVFDIDRFYRLAENGEKTDVKAFAEYVETFDTVIMWGAGNLGTALGKTFLDKGIKLSLYWDKEYESIIRCNDLEVKEPFTGDFDFEKTLIVIGIVNGTLSHTWQERLLKDNGYNHYLLGMQTYEAIACKEEKGKPLNVCNCVNTSICNFNTCKRYMNVLREGKERTGLSVQVLEIIVSERCTLDCKWCGQQSGETKRRFPHKYIDYPLEQIKHSIDVVMDSLDVVGTFSVIGGEAFIHPQISEIIQHCLTKKNVAIISITTNGICNMSDELLDNIKDVRVKINFSNYTDALGNSERKLFFDNVERVKRHGIACNVGKPIWSTITDELIDNPDFSEKKLRSAKEKCVFGPSIAGKLLFACPQTERYFRMEIHDVSDDVIDLESEKDITERIREMLSRDYYNSCKYTCTNKKPTVQVEPGEQYFEES